MIKLKFNKIVKQIGKPITKIAEETGINRNTLSSLAGDQVSGIKFSTLEKLCQTYGLTISDLIEHTPSKPESETFLKKVYRQEAESSLFFLIPPVVSVASSQVKVSQNKTMSFAECAIYIEDGHGYFYWNPENMDRLARAYYDYHKDPAKLNVAYMEFEETCRPLENIYAQLDPTALSRLSNKELVSYYWNTWNLAAKFWNTSIIIDGFDTGVDQEKIKECQEKYGMDLDEVIVLTTPDELAFSQERELAIVRIADSIKDKKLNQASLKEFVKTSPMVKKYKKDYDYYHSNYAYAKHITDEEVVEELTKLLSDKDQLAKDLDRMQNYVNDHAEKVNQILTKRGLKENPLYFFGKLTFWRERRKQVNMICFHIYDAILQAIEYKTGVSKELLKFLTHNEVESMLAGLVEKGTLVKRKNKGCLAMMQADQFSLFAADEAKSIRNELEERALTNSGSEDLIAGQVASRGYAKGKARLVINEKDFDKFQDGEVLVTGMTRPEFVQLMKRACAIVTNEGGITCHAAIVSRELGKPCIIGTKNATELIKDGDLVEVRANHGTVRILR